MPFLRRQQSQPVELAATYSLHETFAYKIPKASLSNASIKLRAAGLIRRVSNIFNGRKKKRDNSSAIGNRLKGRGRNAGSRSPSPGSDLDDIRRPSGLGPRTSDASLHSFNVVKSAIGGQLPALTFEPVLDRNTKQRLRCISSPEIPKLKLKKSMGEALDSEINPLPPRKRVVVLADLPKEAWTLVVFLLPREAVLSLALVSKHISDAVLKALYEILDLRTIGKHGIKKLLTVLVTKQHRLDLVHTFICKSWPATLSSRIDPQTRHTTSPSSGSKFAVVLSNMRHVTALTLPSFDLDLLRHADLRLHHLSFLNHRLSQEEYAGLYSWLTTQPDLLSLSFPNFMDGPPLLQNDHLAPPSQVTTPDASPSSTPTLSPTLTVRSQPLPPFEASPSTQLLPSLKHLNANPAIVMHIFPRPCATNVIVNIDSTLYNGLRPAALLNALRSIANVGLRFSQNVDRRSMEKTLNVAGVILGEPLYGSVDHLMTLNVEVAEICDRVNEIVYKAVNTLLSRSKVLHTLRLCRISDQDSSCLSRSGSSCSWRPAPPPKRPLDMPSPMLDLTSKPLPPPPSFRDVTPASVQRNADDQASELSLLESWAKQCPSLRAVVFFTRGEWVIERESDGDRVPSR